MQKEQEQQRQPQPSVLLRQNAAVREPKPKQNNLDGKNTSGCGFTHEVQEKQPSLCGWRRQLDGFEIGHVIAPPEAREISGCLDPHQVFLGLMDSRLHSTGSRRHNTTHIHISVTEISIQIRISFVSHQHAQTSASLFPFITADGVQGKMHFKCLARFD